MYAAVLANLTDPAVLRARLTAVPVRANAFLGVAACARGCRGSAAGGGLSRLRLGVRFNFTSLLMASRRVLFRVSLMVCFSFRDV